ncbi:MAG: type II toxin-antitoxin system VapB family antitoxin [Pseudolysinimonas sp.]
MSLNIKNEHTHELVRRLAALTGTSQTEAVTEAVQKRLDELETAQADDWEVRRAEILRLAAEIRESLTPEQIADFTADFLYDDETGLPR